MTAALRQKLVESIREYGLVDPLTVRPLGDNGQRVWQILDGENRFEVAIDEGYTSFTVTELEGLDEAQAKKLTVILNELHGQADPGRLGDLLDDILRLTSLDELRFALPYDDKVLAGYLSQPLPALPKLDAYKERARAREETVPGEPWVERLYRMPKSVALVIDEAIERARDGQELEPWQALERVAADYLSG